MITVHALYDGEVFRPESPVNLSANSRVYLVIEPTGQALPEKAALTFLRIAKPAEQTSPKPAPPKQEPEPPRGRIEYAIRAKKETGLTFVQWDRALKELLGRTFTVEGTINNVFSSSHMCVKVAFGRDSELVFLKFSPPREELLEYRMGQLILACGTLTEIEKHTVLDDCLIWKADDPE